VLAVHVKFVKFGQVVQQWKWGEAGTKTDELISRDMTNVFCLPLPQKGEI
jgi:hypothetical protein